MTPPPRALVAPCRLTNKVPGRPGGSITDQHFNQLGTLRKAWKPQGPGKLSPLEAEFSSPQINFHHFLSSPVSRWDWVMSHGEAWITLYDCPVAQFHVNLLLLTITRIPGKREILCSVQAAAVPSPWCCEPSTSKSGYHEKSLARNPNAEPNSPAPLIVRSCLRSHPDLALG